MNEWGQTVLTYRLNVGCSWLLRCLPACLQSITSTIPTRIGPQTTFISLIIHNLIKIPINKPISATDGMFQVTTPPNPPQNITKTTTTKKTAAEKWLEGVGYLQFLHYFFFKVPGPRLREGTQHVFSLKK